MKKFLGIFLVSLALVFSSSTFANKIGVIYDSGGKFDKSFNELAFRTAERVKNELGWDMVEFEAANNTQIEQGMRKVADRGATLIVAMGFAQADAVAAVAPEYPDINFVNVDVCWLDDPAGNIYQACYREHEGSFLVGMIAAMASKTGKVGFVGGMDIPLIRKFQGGYEQGALYANPDIEIFANMTGTTPEAWNNPTKGAELAKAQIDKGADVVYQAAGGTGIGVLQAAADAGVMGIGVDTNQNWMHPTMLTSMLKRLDLTIFEQAEKTAAGTFQPAIVVLGLAEGMVGYAKEDGQVTAEMESAVAAASADIISGKIVVADWSQE
ncbi:BMP family ABC transporter substrate-binding protein [Alphaproteobacteria bacterium]|nr:BMP family ABC transporter substrate-binding protein [Alphaproteobacteria bacterium]